MISKTSLNLNDPIELEEGEKNKDSFWYKEYFGIKVFEMAAVLALYFFFALSYHVTLWVSTLSIHKGIDRLLSFGRFIDQAGLGYSIKLLITIPFWWLIFRKLSHWSLRSRLSLHLVGLPLFSFLFQWVYYRINELIGWYHLTGPSSVWDIYIPGLFYCIQFGMFHAYEYYLNNKRNLQLKAAVSQAAIKSELSALKAQLNPHFLYNVFNTISASVPPQQEKTREMIAQLSDLFRYQLKASSSELVTLGEELDFVTIYLELEKARFEDRLKIKIDVPENLRKEMIPPMILQPLIENSIKHGISSLIKGGEVSIRIHKLNGVIYFEVADTGVGVEDKTNLFDKGIGLTNTKLRLEKIYGSEMIFSDNQPQGLKIQFAI